MYVHVRVYRKNFFGRLPPKIKVFDEKDPNILLLIFLKFQGAREGSKNPIFRYFFTFVLAKWLTSIGLHQFLNMLLPHECPSRTTQIYPVNPLFNFWARPIEIQLF